MKKIQLPQTDSITALAHFWDTHDVTDFLDELEEVTAPVFERADETAITIRLHQQDAEALENIARARGIGQTTLLKEWVEEKLHAT